MKITRVPFPRCSVGEGPAWDEVEQSLYGWRNVIFVLGPGLPEPHYRG